MIPEAATSRTPGRWAVRVGAALFFLIFAYLAWRRQDAFEMGRFDLGNMSQAVWTTAHGQFLEFTDVAGNQTNRLAVHVDPILVLFAPFYWVWSNPKVLLAAQAGVVAVGAFPVFWLAREELKDVGSRYLPAAVALTYLLYPPLQYAVLDEFHPVTLAAPLLLFAIWYLRQRKYPAAAIFLILAVLTKEEISLLVAALGIYAVIIWQDRRAGMLVTVSALAWFAVATQIVMPYFNDGNQSVLLQRYSEVGGSVVGIIETVFTDPAKAFGVAFSQAKADYLPLLLFPLLLVPLLAPAALLVAVPEIAVNLLSSQEAQSSYRFHYVAPLVPILIWSTILGVKRLGLASARLARFMPAILLAVVIVSGWLMGPLPMWSKLPLGSQHKVGSYSPDEHDKTINRALKLVPKRASVSATNQLGAHLSERDRVFTFPTVDRAEYVVVDEVNPSFGDARGTSDQAAAVVSLRQDSRYRLIFAEDGVLVFKARSRVKTSQSTKTRLRVKMEATKSSPRNEILS